MNRKPKVSKENLQTAKRLLKYVKFDRINFGIIVPQVFNR